MTRKVKNFKCHRKLPLKVQFWFILRTWHYIYSQNTKVWKNLINLDPPKKKINNLTDPNEPNMQISFQGGFWPHFVRFSQNYLVLSYDFFAFFPGSYGANEKVSQTA